MKALSVLGSIVPALALLSVPAQVSAEIRDPNVAICLALADRFASDSGAPVGSPAYNTYWQWIFDDCMYRAGIGGK